MNISPVISSYCFEVMTPFFTATRTWAATVRSSTEALAEIGAVLLFFSRMASVMAYRLTSCTPISSFPHSLLAMRGIFLHPSAYRLFEDQSINKM